MKVLFKLRLLHDVADTNGLKAEIQKNLSTYPILIKSFCSL